ncbi:MAG TPA: hypothetical protein EYN38_04670, partial [Flavobacteriales bacterium]|nr:hypothetical protein [Flavobacteriales bacterium]
VDDCPVSVNQCSCRDPIQSSSRLPGEAQLTGDPVIMDTAVYFGHREMDLAMSKLFGGFDSRFYISYNKAFQLEKGWEPRMDICNLYPLLVHVNLFGGSYLAQIESILRRF